MEDQSFTLTITVTGTPPDVFEHITKVSKWWARDFEGSNTKPDDEFVICHPGQHYSKQLVTEFIPGKRLVCLVTQSEMSWLEKDKAEWTGTRMIFELTPIDDKNKHPFYPRGPGARERML